ncbi:hypothetical protein BJ741DRAFT_618028 [Chytriomyces cf. hyalinus JEL632]|nr:hypothetical protein BJ741DRAFT_618028 [Chytriomyces cf. hyalinus JEL632]
MIWLPLPCLASLISMISSPRTRQKSKRHSRQAAETSGTAATEADLDGNGRDPAAKGIGGGGGFRSTGGRNRGGTFWRHGL